MEALGGILKKSFARNTRNDSEVCPVCGQETRKTAEILGVVRSYRITCKCEQAQLEREKKERENLEKMQKVKKLKSLSLLGERYKDVSFKNTKTDLNPSFDEAFKRCKKYCEIYEETVENGYGIYLFGDKGVGKTHSATRF